MVLERNGVLADVLRSGSMTPLYSYSAPDLRWFLASRLETRAVWVCGVREAGNLTTLKLTSKGRAPCACGAGELRDAGSMMVWWRAFP